MMVGVMMIWPSREPRAPSPVFYHDELRGRDSSSQHPLGTNVIAVHRQAAERRLQLGHRQAGVEQGAKHHIARDAGKAVEVQEPAHSFPNSLKLQYRASPRMM